jgi:hypothetical protein
MFVQAVDDDDGSSPSEGSVRAQNSAEKPLWTARAFELIRPSLKGIVNCNLKSPG